ncbi:hypothetical protein BDP27DRAFT_1330186, partial [Rhodocollybia butyracea]
MYDYASFSFLVYISCFSNFYRFAWQSRDKPGCFLFLSYSIGSHRSTVVAFLLFTPAAS